MRLPLRAAVPVGALALLAAVVAASGGGADGRAVAFYAGGGAVGAGRAPTLELHRTGFKNTGEPNVGITNDGTLWSDAREKVVRSTDGGRTWKDVTPPGHATTLDPFLYVDKVTSRVYKSDLAGTCQLLSWTDNKAASWTQAPAACNQSDHQSLSAAPGTTVPSVTYQNVLYNCSQTAGYNGYSVASGCARSLDGGLSWTPTGTYAFTDPSPYGAAPAAATPGWPVTAWATSGRSSRRPTARCTCRAGGAASRGSRPAATRARPGRVRRSRGTA